MTSENESNPLKLRMQSIKESKIISRTGKICTEVLSSLMAELENISEKNKKILKNNQYRHMLESIDIQELQSNTSKYTDYGDMLSSLGEYDSEIKRENAVVEKLTKLGQKCPTCSQHISNNIKQSMITEAATKVKIAEGVKNDLRKRIESIKAENAEYKSCLLYTSPSPRD